MATTIEAAKRRLDIAHLRRQRAQGAWLRGARGDVSGRAGGERERAETRREYEAAEVALAAALAPSAVEG